MSKSNSLENDLLLHLFNNTAIALVGDAVGVRGSTVAGSLYVSLHTADPGEAGTQTTSEIAYTSYARVAVTRASGAGGWTVSTNSVTNTSAVTFPACTGSSGTATYFGVGTDSSGTGKLLYSGAITTPGSGLAISTGITPSIDPSALTITED